MRDIKGYTTEYLNAINGFEDIKVRYRRRFILDQLNKYNSKNILEIGCGMSSIAEIYQDGLFTIVEPSSDFVESVQTSNYSNVKQIIQGFYEDDAVQNELTDCFDTIICSSLLHEVEKPEVLVKKIHDKCNESTKVIVIVPNSESIHRLLGVKMGTISSSKSFTSSNIRCQQNTVYSIGDLKKTMISKGFRILDEGGFFLKPFSHRQMQLLLANKIIDQSALDGLYLLGRSMPEHASEIYVVCSPV